MVKKAINLGKIIVGDSNPLKFIRSSHVGKVDCIADEVLWGWCFAMADPSATLEVQIRFDGNVIAAVSTGLGRPDVAKAYPGAINSGFAFSVHSMSVDERKRFKAALDEAIAASEWRPRRFSFHEAISGFEIPSGSSFIFDRASAARFSHALDLEQKVVSADPRPGASLSQYRGNIDQIDSAVVRGWCFSTTDPSVPVRLEICFDDIVLGSILAQGSRPDVAAAAGVPCWPGFSFSFSACAKQALRPALQFLESHALVGRDLASIVQVRLAGTDLQLSRGPIRSDEADLRSLRDALAARLDDLANNTRHRIVADLLDPGSAPVAARDDDVRVVAFYLPQYHPTAENDTWWGDGFTEWNNVVTAKPLFADHDQPRIPADLGFYDLRASEVQRRQIDLARQHGIGGFCYYFYWFSGTTLLTLPIDRHVEEDLPLDFCLCWANENWSRRWDGSERDVLMSQQHNPEDDASFIDAVMPYFNHGRYIKIDGAPLLLVYRMSLMQDPQRVVEGWRAAARTAGFPDLHICMVESFGLSDPSQFGADSSCQFPPHGVEAKDPINGSVDGLEPGFSGVIYDYAEVVASEVRRPDAAHLRFRAAMPSWDNTARRGKVGNVFHGASPALFEAWLSVLCAKARRDLPEGRRLVFVNAWNEWAEGAHLEPDRKNGRANLKAVRAALSQRNMLMGDALIDAADGGGDERLTALTGIWNANRHLMTLITDHTGWSAAGPSPFIRRPPTMPAAVDLHEDALVQIDSYDGRGLHSAAEITCNGDRPLRLIGWVRFPRLYLSSDLPVFLLLRRLQRLEGDGDFIAAVLDRPERADVAEAFGDARGGQRFGFDCTVDLSHVTPGAYRLMVLAGALTAPDAACAARSRLILHVG